MCNVDATDWDDGRLVELSAHVNPSFNTFRVRFTDIKCPTVVILVKLPSNPSTYIAVGEPFDVVNSTGVVIWSADPSQICHEMEIPSEANTQQYYYYIRADTSHNQTIIHTNLPLAQQVTTGMYIIGALQFQPHKVYIELGLWVPSTTATGP
ncbi:hypothetical protein AaE_010945, partial [Aphanomyces astaci]